MGRMKDYAMWLDEMGFDDCPEAMALYARQNPLKQSRSGDHTMPQLTGEARAKALGAVVTFDHENQDYIATIRENDEAVAFVGDDTEAALDEVDAYLAIQKKPDLFKLSFDDDSEIYSVAFTGTGEVFESGYLKQAYDKAMDAYMKEVKSNGAGGTAPVDEAPPPRRRGKAKAAQAATPEPEKATPELAPSTVSTGTGNRRRSSPLEPPRSNSEEEPQIRTQPENRQETPKDNPFTSGPVIPMATKRKAYTLIAEGHRLIAEAYKMLGDENV